MEGLKKILFAEDQLAPFYLSRLALPLVLSAANMVIFCGAGILGAWILFGDSEAVGGKIDQVGVDAAIGSGSITAGLAMPGTFIFNKYQDKIDLNQQRNSLKLMGAFMFLEALCLVAGPGVGYAISGARSGGQCGDDYLATGLGIGIFFAGSISLFLLCCCVSKLTAACFDTVMTKIRPGYNTFDNQEELKVTVVAFGAT